MVCLVLWAKKVEIPLPVMKVPDWEWVPNFGELRFYFLESGIPLPVMKDPDWEWILNFGTPHF